MAITISTWKHGIDATKTSIKILNNNGTALDSVEKGVKVTEADPKVRTVGYGGYTDDTGKVTVDASIMDHEGNAGSVAYLENIKHPISVARKVMESSRHVMLVGSGAYNFAIDNGFQHETLLTNQSDKDWKEWKKNKDPKEISDKNHDTITMLSQDNLGNLAGASTTSGLAYKSDGRVGDSPIVGSGIFVDNEVGAAGATGIGEEIMKSVGSFFIVELMRQGYLPNEACKMAIERIAKKYNKKVKFQVAFIALRKDGKIGSSAINDGFFYNVAEENIFKTVGVDSYYKSL
ncbi:MAG: glycosylasparaginase [Gammaproteobacteria bacterium]|nr:glycosylasparaginase [Gammaproteobacteria bacterium]